MGRRSLALRAITTPAGCYVVVSHKHNADGYFRKSWGNKRSGDHVLIMFHRVIWLHRGNEIPVGHEIDHTCGNRACFNVSHLRVVPREVHLVETNRHRWINPLNPIRSTKGGTRVQYTYPSRAEKVANHNADTDARLSARYGAETH